MFSPTNDALRAQSGLSAIPASYTPGGGGYNIVPDPYQLRNVMPANIDNKNLQIPSMPLSQLQPQVQQTQVAPGDLQHLQDIIQQMTKVKQDQSTNNGGLLENILSQRFQPTLADAARSTFESNQAGQYVSPETIAIESLSPYSAMAKIQSELTNSKANGLGGGTGVLASKLMADNPGMTFTDALYRIQTGLRQGQGMDANGGIINLPGAVNAAANMAGGKKGAEQGAMLNYAGPIAEATQVGDVTGKAKGANLKKEIIAPQIEGYLQQAEKLLPDATGGGMETTARDVHSYFGNATAGSKIDSQLSVIGAALTANVPRMEGPQSDYDVQLYSKAAGDLANSKLPTETRLAAIKTIREINNKYGGGGVAGTSPAQSSIPPDAISHLRQNPALAPAFEQKYGVSAKDYLQ